MDEENWRPRPSRLLKCWSDTPGYKQFVSNSWKSLNFEGWGGYVLREKFKLIKLALKGWHASYSRNLPAKISSLKERQATLDGKGEINALSADDCDELHEVSANIHSLSRLNTSICWQQSRNQWLCEGDTNTKYFHSILSARRRHNAICSILVDGARIEGVHPVRHAVFTHFAHHFMLQAEVRPSVSNHRFRTLSVEEGGSLTKPFSVDEVKEAIWDCGSFKSPGPDGVNFGFIKDFWLDLKYDVCVRVPSQWQIG